jgi:hypothetical protein
MPVMMEAARTSETSVENYFTRQYIPEDKSELQYERNYTGSKGCKDRFSTNMYGYIFLSVSDTNFEMIFVPNLPRTTRGPWTTV